MANLQPQWHNLCCNPFNKPHHYIRKKSQLRVVTKAMCKKFPSILQGETICDACRKKLATVTTPKKQITLPQEHSNSSSESDVESPNDELFDDPQATLAIANECLVAIGETPLAKRKLRSKQYKKQKVEAMTAMMQKVGLEDKREMSDEGEIIAQLKEKYCTASSSGKIQILTVLPKSWSIRKIEEEFGASNRMARKAKELVKEKGILSTPNPKPGRTLSQHTTDTVTSFYESDETSRIMPGKKDCVSVRTVEGRVSIQKRLILSSLKELYLMFKDRFPNEKIGFSKFAELRPKNCILAGASGTHSVCVCTFHQNVKLMIHSANQGGLTGDSLTTYHHCIAQVICNPPLPRCYLRNCKECPGLHLLKELLHIALDENMIDTITYKQWVSVDRSTLNTITSTSDEFVEFLCEKLEQLIPHSFIATQQATFFNECKSRLRAGEVLIQADFSENYSFVVQDAVQGFHWNNSQATVHPFVIYYRHSGEERHLSFTIISDCLNHDTIAVFLFQKTLITFLKRVLPCQPKKFYYYSDGAASQYKNRKNFINLCNHERDFGIQAEWHFSATSHGKGACDGVGGTVKRLAARASLQRPYEEQIITPFQLFEWASNNIPGIVFRYCSHQEYDDAKAGLEERFQNARRIPGTRKLHSFIPISRNTVRVKPYSLSVSSKEERVTKQEQELDIEAISGYVICVHNSQWWLAFVLEVDTENVEVKLTLMHPHGPSRSFKYPSIPDIVIVSLTEVMTKVNPKTPTSCTYTLARKESKAATEKLAKIYID